MRTLTVVLALCALPVDARQTQSPPRPVQQQATGTARIQGRVVNADTGTAVRAATVSLFSPDTAARATSTDTDGRFEFAGLPAGRFTIRAVKGGFVTTTFGQSAANPRAVQADGVFSLTGLPPGNYLAVALTSAEAGEWAEPDNLDRLRAKATTFTLADRESKTLVLVRR